MNLEISSSDSEVSDLSVDEDFTDLIIPYIKIFSIHAVTKNSQALWIRESRLKLKSTTCQILFVGLICGLEKIDLRRIVIPLRMPHRLRLDNGKHV